jgi:hypothetical protein
MLKPMIAATALFALAGSSFVYAQQRTDSPVGFGPRAEHQHRQLSADDVNAFADARIAALKAGLELTPDQAKNWPAFETALRNMVQLRAQRMQARQAARQQSQNGSAESQPANGTPTPATPFDRMERRADAMAKRGAALKQIADAGAPLYSSLNDAQKQRFTMLARMLRPHHRHEQGGGWGQEGRRFGQGGQDGGGWRHEGRRFGQNDQKGQNGRDGQGWGRGRRFGENDGPDWGHHHRFDRDGGGQGGMHNLMENDGDQDSQL